MHEFRNRTKTKKKKAKGTGRFKVFHVNLYKNFGIAGIEKQFVVLRMRFTYGGHIV